MFSITTLCPSAADKAGTRTRAKLSTPPPAGKGTTARIGRLGKPCARTAGAARREAPNRARRGSVSMVIPSEPSR